MAKYIIEGGKTEFKYYIEKSIGDTKNRIVLKAKGDDLKQVLSDMKTLTKESL